MNGKIRLHRGKYVNILRTLTPENSSVVIPVHRDAVESVRNSVSRFAKVSKIHLKTKTTDKGVRVILCDLKPTTIEL